MSHESQKTIGLSSLPSPSSQTQQNPSSSAPHVTASPVVRFSGCTDAKSDSLMAGRTALAEAAAALGAAAASTDAMWSYFEASKGEERGQVAVIPRFFRKE